MERPKGPCLVCGATEASQWKEIRASDPKYPGHWSHVCKKPECHRKMNWQEPKKAPGRPAKAARIVTETTEPTIGRRTARPLPLNINEIIEFRGIR